MIPARKPLTALLLLTLLGPNIPAVAKDKNAAVGQETLKAGVTQWREASPLSTNTSDIEFQQAFPDAVWWEQFHDPYLNRYIQQAIRSNLNLELAHERIEEARAIARATLGREFPQVSLGGTFNRQRNSATIIRSGRPGGQVNNNGTGAGVGGGGFALGEAINFWSIPLSVSYEADIWRKNRDRTRAANEQAEAVERDFQSVHVILATDVANAYFNLLAADQLIRLQQGVIAVAEADLAHAQRLFEAGVNDEENVVLRQGRLTDFRAQLQSFYELQALALNQLAVLMGQTPYQAASLERGDWEQYTIPAEIPAGIPSELLMRRPDILAAEDRLAAAGLLVQVARKELLPSINLTGQFGFSSASFENLFDWESRVWALGASLLQGLYTGGQARANLRIFRSRYEQQLLLYRDAILQAFREVDDSLASLKAHRNAYNAYSDSLNSLRQRQQLQQNRLAAGAISEGDINPVTLEVLLAQEGLVQTKLLALTDTLSLYKALGGGY